ncbi:MAG TPA: DUF1003 domain-containing protein [Nitrosopumilaceae archaeon]|jgi:uncharacterized membrane protein|nr:DUF1003 domain-containing protein [Nitrosopumilaceae archaeon]
MPHTKKLHCKVSNKQISANEAMPADALSEPILGLIRKVHPDFTKKDFISVKELNKFRAKYAAEILGEDNPTLDEAEQEIVSSIENNEFVSRSPEELELEEKQTFGQRLSDRIAEFGGSWRFIIAFGFFMLLWIVINAFHDEQFDPYPYILLNLILSCVAAMQAPVIMMSQNRKEEKDRQRSENDYKINLKAELEILQLHEKVDMLLVKFSEHQKTMQE